MTTKDRILKAAAILVLVLMTTGMTLMTTCDRSTSTSPATPYIEKE